MKKRRITRIAAALTLVLGIATTAAGQEQATIDDLTAPSSPAFILLDASPAAVERPDNAKAFAVNLLNRVSTEKGLPQNYALEVSPYWLASHPGLTFHKYQNPSPGQSILQSFLLSVATVPIPGATTGAASTGTRLGIGFRTSIINGQPNQALEDKISNLADINGRILDAIQVQRAPASTAAQRTQAIADEQKARADAKTLALEIQGLDAERVGVFLTVAGGEVWAFPGDDVSQQKAEKAGLWITPSYRFRACNSDSDQPCETRLDLLGVVRGMKTQGEGTRWDYGGRLIWRAKKELYLSVESLRRNARAATATVAAQTGSDRTVGLLEYRIKTDLVLYGSFGRDFEKDNGVKPLVSLMGLNLGFGSKATVLADKPQ